MVKWSTQVKKQGNQSNCDLHPICFDKVTNDNWKWLQVNWIGKNCYEKGVGWNLLKGKDRW